MTKKPSIFVDSAESLEKAMHFFTPISKAMGVSVLSYDLNSLTVTAPLAPNINPHQSAFGGSLFSIAALAGWGLLQMKLSELLLDCNTVVMSGEVTYKRPVLDDLLCVCNLPNDWANFQSTLLLNRATSVVLSSVFKKSEQEAMRLSARYRIKIKE